MRIVSAHVARPVEDCWRVFTDFEATLRWVPGLRSAKLVTFDLEGLPEEVRYEFVAGLIYSLRYTYDTGANVVRWEPVDEEGKRGGVRGFARFTAIARDGSAGPRSAAEGGAETIDGGTQVTYALEHDEGRKAAERAIDSPQMLVEAFAQFMHEDSE